MLHKNLFEGLIKNWLKLIRFFFSNLLPISIYQLPSIMSLLQYGFKRQKINKDSIQENVQKPENSLKDMKSSNVNKVFKTKWLSEFSWLHYDNNNKKMF